MLRYFTILSLVSTFLLASPISESFSGLSNPDHLVDFGANQFASFTTITDQFSGQGVTFEGTRYFTTTSSNNLIGGFLTRENPSPILRITFTNQAEAATFVYHGIGNLGSSIFQALLHGQIVESFSLVANQSQSNNFYGFSDIIFDEIIVFHQGDFNMDTLAFNDSDVIIDPPAPSVPEPATWFLGGIGFLFSLRSRKK